MAPDCHDIPRETYLPRRKGTKFSDLSCPFECDAVFPNKAQLQRHRVALHKRRRAPRDGPADQFDHEPALADVDKILRRAARDSSEFIVYTTSGSYEWRTLPLDDARVKDFLSEEESKDEQLPEVVDMEAWVAGGTLIDDDEEPSDSNSDICSEQSDGNGSEVDAAPAANAAPVEDADAQPGLVALVCDSDSDGEDSDNARMGDAVAE